MTPGGLPIHRAQLFAPLPLDLFDSASLLVGSGFASVAGPAEALKIGRVQPLRVVRSVEWDDMVHFGDRNDATNFQAVLAEGILGGVPVAEP